MPYSQQDIHSLIQFVKNELAETFHDPTIQTQYAWWLIEKITKSSKTALVLSPTIMLSSKQMDTLHIWMRQLIKEHKPIQYILGTVPFAQLDIIVKPPVLIPRPETEEWCLWLMNRCKPIAREQLTVLDLCTGSGCIGLALAKTLRYSTIYATDISPDALDLAQENARHNSISNVVFLQSNLYQKIPEQLNFDLIVANPPYIAEHEWNDLDSSVTAWEDKKALVALDEGLAIIKRIIAHAHKRLKYNKLFMQHHIPSLVIEIGYQHGHAVREYMARAKFTFIQVHKDSYGKDRFVSGYLVP